MVSFRKLEHKLCLVNNEKYVNLLCKTLNAEANGLLCYGYVDEEAGLTFESLAPTLLVDGDYSVSGDAGVVLKIRAETVADTEIIPIENKALTKCFEDRIKLVEQHYYQNTDTLECRAITELDPFRHPFFPDDLQALLTKDGIKPEAIWVRTKKHLGCHQGTFIIRGKLLDEPFHDYGIHAGDTITFGALNSPDRGPFCAIIL
ncbi:MAG: hypothetical protein GXY49_10760 [Syntrophomonadaceae bacterium]|nr:hypothetical protein [Syntrophomonadaceae bacterium]